MSQEWAENFLQSVYHLLFVLLWCLLVALVIVMFHGWWECCLV